MTTRKNRFGGSALAVAAVGMGIAVFAAPAASADPGTTPTDPVPAPPGASNATTGLPGLPSIPSLPALPGLGGDTSAAGSTASAVPAQAAAVPAELQKPLQDAGNLCPQVKTPLLASQINQASQFSRAAQPAPDLKPGASGPAMLSPEILQLFSGGGQKATDAGSGGPATSSTATSSTSSASAPAAQAPGDSVLAQGRFMCTIADKVDKANPAGAAPETSTDPMAFVSKIPGLSSIPGLDKIPGANGLTGSPKNTPAYLAVSQLANQKDAPGLAGGAGLDQFVTQAVKMFGGGGVPGLPTAGTQGLPEPMMKALGQILSQAQNYAAPK